MVSRFLSLFAAEEGPHISLKAEEVFHIGDFVVTNSMIYGVVVALTTLLVGVMAAKRITDIMK